jgi:hypothetical protein
LGNIPASRREFAPVFVTATGPRRIRPLLFTLYCEYGAPLNSNANGIVITADTPSSTPFMITGTEAVMLSSGIPVWLRYKYDEDNAANDLPVLKNNWTRINSGRIVVGQCLFMSYTKVLQVSKKIY